MLGDVQVERKMTAMVTVILYSAVNRSSQPITVIGNMQIVGILSDVTPVKLYKVNVPPEKRQIVR